MKMPRSVLLAVCAALLLPATLPAGELPTAKPEDVGLSSEKLQQARAAVRKLIKDGEVAGAIILVARHGKVVFLEAQGVRDLATGKPMEKDTICRFYSMSKPVTTVAAMILWEEGRFKLDDPVSKYLPEFKGVKVFTGGTADSPQLADPQREMTVRDLMRHTAGLTYGFFGDLPADTLYRKSKILEPGASLQTMVERLGKIPLAHQPGTRFHYSVATDVLGRLVEVVSEKSLDEFLRGRIFEPLDMKDTGFFVPEDRRDRLAASHGKNAAGELDGRRVLKAETVRLMTSNQLPAEAMPLSILGARREGVGFGLGFSVRVTASQTEPADRVGEFGWGGAASTHFWISPKDDLFVIALQQFQPFNPVLEQRLKPIIYEALTDPKK